VKTAESVHEENKHTIFFNSSSTKATVESKLFPKLCKKLPPKFQKLESILTVLVEYVKKIVLELIRALDSMFDKKIINTMEKSNMILNRAYV